MISSVTLTVHNYTIMFPLSSLLGCGSTFPEQLQCSWKALNFLVLTTDWKLSSEADPAFLGRGFKFVEGGSI